MANEKKEIIRAEQQAHSDALAASKPALPAQEGAEAAEEVHERLDGESGHRWAHGDSTAQEKALNAPTTPGTNTTGFVATAGNDPAFVPDGTSIDRDGLIGQPAERHAWPPSMEPVPTAGAPSAPPASAPASAGWASEIAAARAGADDMMMKLTPAGVVDPDPFVGFARSKSHRQGDTGMYDSIPGGTEVAQGHEVLTVDEVTRPGSAAALVSKPAPSQPNGQPALPGEHPVAGPSIRAVSPADIKAAGS